MKFKSGPATLIGMAAIALVSACALAVRADSAGPAIGPPIPVGNVPTMYPRVVIAGGRRIEAWQSSFNFYAQASIDGVPVAISGFSGKPIVAAGRDNFLFVGEGGIATRVRLSDGKVIDVPPIQLGDWAFQQDFDAIYDGTDFVVVSSGFELRVARIHEDGTVTESALLGFSSDTKNLVMAHVHWTGTSLLVPYVRESSTIQPYMVGDADLWIAQESRVGDHLETRQALVQNSIGFGSMTTSSALHQGRITYVWNYFGAPPSILIAQSTADGKVLLAPQRIYLRPSNTGFTGPPQIVWNGIEFVIAWVEGPRESDEAVNWAVRGIRAASNGQLIDAEPFDIVRGDDPLETEVALTPITGGTIVSYAGHHKGADILSEEAFSRFIAQSPPPPPRRRSARP